MNVLQQAIEALIIGLDYVKSEQFENSQRFKGYEHLAPNDDLSAKEIEEAIEALRKALEQEPVAWMYEFWADRGHKGLDFEEQPSADNTPLYAYPQPKVEQEPVKLVKYNCICGKIMKFESDQGVVAPKREWVGLTDEERQEIAFELPIDAVRITEATLKEKNDGVEKTRRGA